MSSLCLRRPQLLRRCLSTNVPAPAVRRRDGTTAPINKLRGFIEYERKPEPYRPPAERLTDYGEINAQHEPGELKRQSARCMDCGTPFCQTNTGCPINNLIPEFNQMVFDDTWKQVYTNLSSTNNFPEFTGRVCPAPCEGSCVAGLVDEAVTIKNMEYSIIDKAWAEGWVVPRPPTTYSGKRVAVIGSGPAGLAAADELNRKYGHEVTVFERAPKAGGLLTYGIPNMKLDKNTVQRRIDLMAEEGVTFACNTEVGSDATSLMDDFDAVVLAIGSTVPNNLPIPGRELDGIHFAMEFLTANQKRLFADPAAVSNGAWSGLTSKYSGDFIDAANKNVVVIGGGDTGTDCIGTSLRHGCETLTNFELFPQPPDTRAEGNPWPAWPRIYRTDYGHEEAAHRYGEDQRRYSILSKEFVGDESGKVKAVKTTQISVGADGRFEEVAGTEKEWPADLVVLAMGFRHPEATISETLKLEADARNNVKANTADYRTSSRGVFAAGDCRRGQSLVVWAINEGRNSASACDAYLRQGAEASW
jgi:NAD(P)H-dependent glutamate synthase small subunit